MSKESELELHNGKLFSYETGNKFVTRSVQFSHSVMSTHVSTPKGLSNNVIFLGGALRPCEGQALEPHHLDLGLTSTSLAL